LDNFRGSAFLYIKHAVVAKSYLAPKANILGSRFSDIQSQKMMRDVRMAVSVTPRCDLSLLGESPVGADHGAKGDHSLQVCTGSSLRLLSLTASVMTGRFSQML